MKTSKAYNEKYNELLGESYRKVHANMIKLFLFKLVQETNNDICFRCKKKIENANECSIEHKIQWRSYPTDELKEKAFYDLNNIAFSHKKCNCAYSNWKKPASHYFGVEKISLSSYRVSINYLGNRYKFCGFNSKELAAEYVDLANTKYNKGQGKINFPDKIPEYEQKIADGWSWPELEEKLKKLDNTV